jgi:hypothetical protein
MLCVARRYATDELAVLLGWALPDFASGADAIPNMELASLTRLS